jgi:hypothetical protein
LCLTFFMLAVQLSPVKLGGSTRRVRVLVRGRYRLVMINDGQTEEMRGALSAAARCAALANIARMYGLYMIPS